MIVLENIDGKIVLLRQHAGIKRSR